MSSCDEGTKVAGRQSPGPGTVGAAEWRHAMATRRKASPGPNYQPPIMLRFDSLLGVNRGPYMFLRNEPKFFRGDFGCIHFIDRSLYGLQDRFAGGFVLGNEPNFGGSSRPSSVKSGRISGERTHSRIVAWLAGATFFSPWIRAIRANAEKPPGPKIRTIMQVNRNSNGERFQIT